MEDNGGIKVNGIRQIVKLKEMLHKWQTVALSPKATTTTTTSEEVEESSFGSHFQGGGGISPTICRRLRNFSYCKSDEDSNCQSPEAPPFDVPKGYLAVYVGPKLLQLRRFIIPTMYLTHPLFKLLLEKVEEEFGFDHSGGLTIPCEVETFKFILNYIDHHKNDPHLDHHVDDDNADAGETSITAEE